MTKHAKSSRKMTTAEKENLLRIEEYIKMKHQELREARLPLENARNEVVEAKKKEIQEACKYHMTYLRIKDDISKMQRELTDLVNYRYADRISSNFRTYKDVEFMKLVMEDKFISVNKYGEFIADEYEDNNHLEDEEDEDEEDEDEEDEDEDEDEEK
jgi:hypothetical protein